MEKTPMTVRGAEALREELERLKTQERPRIVKEIATARADGDLRENAEYQYAKEGALIPHSLRQQEARSGKKDNNSGE